MAKSSYIISVMRKGREKDYRDFWDRGVKVNVKGEELDSVLVGFTEEVDANSLGKAISIVQKNCPDLTIARDHSSKVG